VNATAIGPIFLDSEGCPPAQVFIDWCLHAPERQHECVVIVAFALSEYWLDDGGEISLYAVYCHYQGQRWLSVTDKPIQPSGLPVQQQYAAWVDEHRCASILLGSPVMLSPVVVPKPWGREVWFSGVESRGVCGFATGENITPVPWIQAAMPNASMGRAGDALVLLKILDPSPEPVTGDLYFELHEEKREVYVVTHVDAKAWPDGAGFIRYGFDPNVVAAAGSERAFRTEYLSCVQDYEQVRREIDALADGGSVTEILCEKEASLREAMDAYSLMRPLNVGDVVKVPLLLPHSLQHGVRTIEFQTPVYERKILSFAQQVLTQNHWDTAEAVEQMALLAPVDEPFPLLRDEEGISVEKIVDFEDFEVWRVTLDGNISYPVPHCRCYRLLMVLLGSLTVEGLTLGAEQAAIVPALSKLRITSSEPSKRAVFLLATPQI
jgi:protein involved in polysaccharide export with SLBB domain